MMDELREARDLLEHVEDAHWIQPCADDAYPDCECAMIETCVSQRIRRFNERARTIIERIEER